MFPDDMDGADNMAALAALQARVDEASHALATIGLHAERVGFVPSVPQVVFEGTVGRLAFSDRVQGLVDESTDQAFEEIVAGEVAQEYERIRRELGGQ